MYLNVKAIVLSGRRVNEFDRRLSLFTYEKGRLLVLAVGVGRPRSKLAFAVEPGVEAKFRLWTASGSDSAFARIAGGAIAASFPALKASWARMNSALFLCEWTERLTALGQPHPEKYDLLRRALSALETQEEETVRAAFMLQFLARAGYALNEEMLGPLRGETGEAVEILRDYDFTAPASVPCPADRIVFFQEKMLRFVAPLMDGPLRTLAHRRSLENYLEGAAASGKPVKILG